MPFVFFRANVVFVGFDLLAVIFNVLKLFLFLGTKIAINYIRLHTVFQGEYIKDKKLQQNSIPYNEMAPSMNHRVHSGRYFIKTKAYGKSNE